MKKVQIKEHIRFFHCIMWVDSQESRMTKSSIPQTPANQSQSADSLGSSFFVNMDGEKESSLTIRSAKCPCCNLSIQDDWSAVDSFFGFRKIKNKAGVITMKPQSNCKSCRSMKAKQARRAKKLKAAEGLTDWWQIKKVMNIK